MEILRDFFKSIDKRLNDHFVGTFITTFAITNHKLIYELINKVNSPQKIFDWKEFEYCTPFIISILYLVLGVFSKITCSALNSVSDWVQRKLIKFFDESKWYNKEELDQELEIERNRNKELSDNYNDLKKYFEKERQNHLKFHSLTFGNLFAKEVKIIERLNDNIKHFPTEAQDSYNNVLKAYQEHTNEETFKQLISEISVIINKYDTSLENQNAIGHIKNNRNELMKLKLSESNLMN